MRLNRVITLCAMLLALSAVARAQDFRGRINGTVTDNTGAVLPGVTVTASSPALIQPQVQITGAEGDFRFLALPPGLYDVSFELSGFQSVKREGIRVVINQTLTVDQQLQVATLQETVTVTGESPIVDTSTTTMGTNFTKELLTEIPNARDIWAAMSQAPGIQMQGSYDVGGSRTGNQTGYLSYGFDTQNQTKLEGIDTTEATAANAGYFDFGSFEEFQVGGGGSDASTYAGGAVLSISVKSGGDRFSGDWYSDWEGDATISDNVPANLTVSGQPGNGFWVRNALQRGNPIDRQYDINFNLGGPLYKGRAWFFTSYRLNDQYKTILGFDELARSKLSNKYTLKGTFQLTRNNQFIAFLNKREKLQNKRDIGPSVPLSAALYQSSRNYPWKVEWTSVLGSRAFIDVIGANWYNFFPLRPTRDFDLYDGPWGPGRIDTSTNIYFDGGANDGYQDQKRFKPQVYLSMSYFKDGWGGSHDFKMGYDWKRDRRNFFRDQPFDIFYRDAANSALNQLDLYNTPTNPTNDVVYNSAWINDTWKITNRLTLNIGGRYEGYRDGWPEQSVAPNGHPMLANWPATLKPADRARYFDFIAARTVDARTVSQSRTFVPRIGAAYDLTGDNRTVLKLYFGQSVWNSADTLADQENPVGRAQLRYQFVACSATVTTNCDINGNRLLDGPEELGTFQSTQGGAGFVRVDRELKRPRNNEFSVGLEREIREALSGRVSYVYKNMRNVWAEMDAVRAASYTVPITVTDPGPDGRLGTGDEQTFQTFQLPAGVGQDRVYTNPEGNNADFHNVEFAVNRRFSGKWMMLSSFGYTWSTALFDTTSYGRFYSYRPYRRLFGEDGRETATLWNYKIIGRYTLPYDVGISGSWKVQSGQQYGRTISVNFQTEGAQTMRVEPITSNRYPNVAIFDIRFDKSFRFGRAGRLTTMLDVFNVNNAGTVTNFRTTTAGSGTYPTLYQEVTGLLDPRIVRFGIRYDF